MKFSILTPHHNQPDFLKRCVKSVRDQVDATPFPGFTVSHLIQDSNATGWIPTQLRERLGVPDEALAAYQLGIHSEEDQGMYDALNRAFAKSDGEIIGHINCDEQYLPGTLAFVHECFQKDPGLQVLSGAVVITYPDGSYCCSRKPIRPGYHHTAVCHLSLFTAATFYRRTFLEELGVFFDTRFRAAGDADLFARILKSKARLKTSPRYFSLFAETGTNLALSEVAKQERKIRMQEVPAAFVKLRPLIEMHHQVKKLLHGAYFLRPFSYEFINDRLEREVVRVNEPTGIWRDRRRMRLYKRGWFDPHNPLTSHPPGKLSLQPVPHPHLLVVSAPRSGTHLMIDLILNNLPAYKRKPLFVELDKLLDLPGEMAALIQTSGYVIKTHYPVMETGEANPGLPEQLEQLAQKSLVLLIRRDPVATFRSALRMFPWLNQEAFELQVKKQNEFWRRFSPVEVRFEDLTQKSRAEALLRETAERTQTACKKRPVHPPPKARRKHIYFLKFLTRVMGRRSPRINTGIRLGESR